MAAPRPRQRALAAAEEIEYDRVLFFGDAVFALVSALLLRRIEPLEVDSTITEGDDPHG